MKMEMKMKITKKGMIVAGMAALLAVTGMAGCGDIGSSDSTNAAPAAPAATETETATATAAETAAAAAEAAETTSDSSNEFLDDLNKQMDSFKENAEKVTVETNAGAAETAAAETPAEPQTTAAAETPAPATSGAPLSSPELDSNELLASLGERIRVGSKEYGFIDVPANWVQFHEEGVPDGQLLQYSDGIGAQVITMTRYQYMVAQQVADKVYDNLEADPDAEITGSRRCEIEGRSAFRVDCKYNSDMYQEMTVWTVQGDDSYTYYLAIEYTDPAVFELARTFSLEK